MSLTFNHVSLPAIASVLDDGTHVTRTISLADGSQKILGCLLAGVEGRDYTLELADFSERIEIIQGGCDVTLSDKSDHFTQEYYREGQSFVAGSHSRVQLSCTGVVQYVRHFEG